MRRESIEYFKQWYSDSHSKPLILRGARQVGKSTLVRLFCESMGLHLLEINLEIESFNSITSENFDINSLLDEIQLKKKQKIKENTILFFDEIQGSPTLLKLLRYFYEKKPHLKVIAAGSLLEFALNSENFSFPVGRVQFHYLGPMSFREFLWATNQDFLDEKLLNFEFTSEIHSSALIALRNYFFVGGMPEAVKKFSEKGQFVDIREVQSQILQTYAADFPKYNRRINVARISRIFSSLAMKVGEKVIFSKLDVESKSREIRKVVELLIDARVILPCLHSSGNGPSLLAESDDRIFKTFFLDIGLLGSLINLNVDTLDFEFKNNFNLKGELIEQFVAQHLNFIKSSTRPPSLFYHLKDKGSQKAEIDFLIEGENKIIPIEVKSSAPGHLKSLKYFCDSKSSPIGIKTSLAPFSIVEKFINDCKLINIPVYSIEYLKFNFEKLK